MIGKRSIVAIGAALVLVVGAGTAAAAAGKPGPRASAPRLGLSVGAQQGYGVMAGGVVMDAAADYLGLSETALAAARHDGKSLAQVAADRNVSVTGLQQALVAAVETQLNEAVGAGRLTAAQAAQALTRFEAQVQTVVTRTATGPLAGRGGGMGSGLGLGLGPCGGVR
jgi:hypothetical protein